jgi:hypothetical protein
MKRHCESFFAMQINLITCSSALLESIYVLRGVGEAACSVLLTKYCSGDKIEKNEVGGACSAYGVRREACTEFW